MTDSHTCHWYFCVPVIKSGRAIRTLVDLSPEAVLKCLLCLFQLLDVSESVQVRQHAHHLWESVRLQEAAAWCEIKNLPYTVAISLIQCPAHLQLLSAVCLEDHLAARQIRNFIRSASILVLPLHHACPDSLTLHLWSITVPAICCIDDGKQGRRNVF